MLEIETHFFFFLKFNLGLKLKDLEIKSPVLYRLASQAPLETKILVGSIDFTGSCKSRTESPWTLLHSALPSAVTSYFITVSEPGNRLSSGVS